MVAVDAPRPPGRAGAAADEETRLQALADERAAVLRVAELIGRTTDPAEVLATVTAEASRLLGGPATTLVRFDGDRELVVVASHDGPAPVGRRIAFEPDTLPDRVLRRGAVVRVDDYTAERDAELARSFGLAAAVAAPVRVAGAVWGMLTATSAAEPLPPTTERRLDAFVRLATAAVGGSQARTELQALADEQAALRRVAELVARGAASWPRATAWCRWGSGSRRTRVRPRAACSTPRSPSGPTRSRTRRSRTSHARWA
jgi:GAF domain-containing protein